ncbi:peptidoglycan/LPS O-acetylase OafA/YrhL [Actinomycetospora succinea]|uniref:Peptidoglycan/LPS O-acetylase OafA/YrhL n=1 Tax=Actinomycetospora succinea TaxID=663603 RepID=A0A4V3D7S3_9PSEU|nr:acyltransferase [Actinomycetospora succinea]TDQ48957.1 peptidoglycan/LPS O-acetylase OafA/YrhL [Actinomycetospora succinea]
MNAPPKKSKGLIRSLVGIRGYLSIVVVAVHLAPFAIALVPLTAPFFLPIWHHAYVALDLFFVLSGFVITAGYRGVFARWPGWGAFGKFLWARLSRFYPVHLAVLAVLVGAVLGARAIGREIPHGGDLGIDLLRQITLTSGWGGADALTWNGPVWSLSAEWFCYLLIPLLQPLVLLLRTRTACVLGYLVACAIPLVAYSVIGFDDGTITYAMPLPRALGFFLAGACLQQLVQVDRRLPALAGRFTGPIAVLGFGLIVLASTLEVSTMYALPVVGLTVLALGEERGWLDRVLSTRASLYGGEISVAIFLTHVPWLLGASLLINPRTFPGHWGWLGIALLLVGVGVCGWLAFVLVEKPGQRFMRSLVKRPAKAPTQSVEEKTEAVVEAPESASSGPRR